MGLMITRTQKRRKILKKEHGIALFIAIMLSFITLLVIAGLIAVWQRLNMVIFPVKIYSSVREAAGGGIKLLVNYIDGGFFDKIEYAECPPGTALSSNGTIVCCRVPIKYKLLGSNREYLNPIEVCLFNYQPQAGEEVTGAAYTSQAAKVGKGLIYGFNSTAIGPGNVTAHVEAVYVR